MIWCVHPRGIRDCTQEQHQQTSQTCPCSSFAGSPHHCSSPGHLFPSSFLFNISHLLFFPLDFYHLLFSFFFLLYISVTTSLFLLSHDKHCIPLDHMHNAKEVLQLTVLIPIIETDTLRSSQLFSALLTPPIKTFHLRSKIKKCVSIAGPLLVQKWPWLLRNSETNSNQNDSMTFPAKTRTNTWEECYPIPDSWTSALRPQEHPVHPCFWKGLSLVLNS